MSGDETPDLEHRRILVVEDEPKLALDIVLQIEEHNRIVIGPMTSLDQGIKALEDERSDACVLNIRLGPDMVYALADKLLAQDPFYLCRFGTACGHSGSV